MLGENKTHYMLHRGSLQGYLAFNLKQFGVYVFQHLYFCALCMGFRNFNVRKQCDSRFSDQQPDCQRRLLCEPCSGAKKLSSWATSSFLLVRSASKHNKHLKVFMRIWIIRDIVDILWRKTSKNIPMIHYDQNGALRSVDRSLNRQFQALSGVSRMQRIDISRSDVLDHVDCILF